MDVVAAVEGPEEAFRCMEIRRQGPGAGDPAADGGGAADCAVAHAMTRAEAPGAPGRLRAWLAAR
ncbi:hypothetical protein ACFCX3_36590 [Streptomyces virginiae]|uniref:hypothetical protein n=1 Tax=Streptomyces virginiae TaxID=1961 RepID=UPI0035DAC894